MNNFDKIICVTVISAIIMAIAAAIIGPVVYMERKNITENFAAASGYCKKISQEKSFEYYAVNSMSKTPFYQCQLSNKENALPQKIVGIRKNYESGKFEINIPDYRKR